MKAGGVLLVVAGVWVLCQVLGGNALQRLGVADRPKFDSSKLDLVPRPDDGYGPGFRDGQGRPL